MKQKLRFRIVYKFHGARGVLPDAQIETALEGRTMGMGPMFSFSLSTMILLGKLLLRI